MPQAADPPLTSGTVPGWATLPVPAHQRRSTPPLLIWPVLAVGLVAVGLLTSVVGVTLARPEPTGALFTQPSAGRGTDGRAVGGDARGQAEAVDRLLADSSASRATLAPALARVERCREFGAAMPVLQRVADERTDQVARAQALDGSALPAGDRALSLLVETLRLSLAADEAYLSWGRARRDEGCSGARARLRHWDTAAEAARRSDTKNRFARAWSPIADRYGLPRRAAAEI